MIDGRVSSVREARVPLEAFHGEGNEVLLNAVLDTGFTDSLMISEELAQSMGLPQLQAKPYEIGDGSEVEFSRYGLDIMWNGQRRTVAATATKAAVPLIGMRLLYGNLLIVEVIDGGAVRILRMD